MFGLLSIDCLDFALALKSHKYKKKLSKINKYGSLVSD